MGPRFREDDAEKMPLSLMAEFTVVLCGSWQ
jgi:hypothetical protein